MADTAAGRRHNAAVAAFHRSRCTVCGWCGTAHGPVNANHGTVAAAVKDRSQHEHPLGCMVEVVHRAVCGCGWRGPPRDHPDHTTADIATHRRANTTSP